jgi:hypothetical protein
MKTRHLDPTRKGPVVLVALLSGVLGHPGGSFFLQVVRNSRFRSLSTPTLFGRSALVGLPGLSETAVF